MKTLSALFVILLFALSYNSKKLKTSQSCAAALQLPSYSCYNWSGTDVSNARSEFNCQIGVGNTVCENEYCNSLSNLAQGIQYYFAQGDGTCGGCWCCSRQSNLINPFNDGDLVTFESVYFANHFLRIDPSNCSATNACNCGVVNAQVTAGPNETHLLTKNSNGSFCIRSNVNNNVYLSFDTRQCTGSSGSGCGVVSTIYSTANSCSGREAFRFISNGNGTYGIANDCQNADYIRLDGSSISSYNSSGGGFVNGQVYSPDATSGGYEVFKIVKH
jgi:hypothetical protein